MVAHPKPAEPLPITEESRTEYRGFVGAFGPGEPLAALVPAIDARLDSGDEILDRGEHSLADGLTVIPKKTSTKMSHNPEVE